MGSYAGAAAAAGRRARGAVPRLCEEFALDFVLGGWARAPGARAPGTGSAD